MRRVTPKADAGAEGSDYFPPRSIKFFRSGCTYLDCVLSGGYGWPLGRVVNIIGDRSVGKTLIAIEAAANFARQYPKGDIRYCEAEGAFDVDYAEIVGLPVDRVNFGPEGIDTLWDTIEDVGADMQEFLEERKSAKQPGLYIIDSFDGLSSRAEMKRNLGDGSYGMEKQKLVSELFRRVVRAAKQSDTCIMVISQVRENIGVTFGDKLKRAGGKALDFYASIALWLSLASVPGQATAISESRGGVKRVVGVNIKARTKKNKIAPSNRDCKFPILYSYGIDDLSSSLDMLEEYKQSKLLAASPSDLAKLEKKIRSLRGSDYWEQMDRVDAAVLKAWNKVEMDFRPVRRKYDARV